MNLHTRKETSGGKENGNKEKGTSGTHAAALDLVVKICPAPAAYLEPRTPCSMIHRPAVFFNIRFEKVN